MEKEEMIKKHPEIKAADTEKIKQSTREEDELAPGDVIEIHERFF